jgi:hypothetical protein
MAACSDFFGGDSSLKDCLSGLVLSAKKTHPIIHPG